MHELFRLTFKYYGVDWIVTLLVFIGIFLLGNKKQLGFIVGMISACFGIVFSVQVGSIANGVSSVVLFWLYLRGYLKWQPASPRAEDPPSRRIPSLLV